MTAPTDLPAYNPAHHIPPPLDLATLVLVPSKPPTWWQHPDAICCRAHLSTLLAQRLNLKADQPIDLHPPGSDHHWWHLDLRPQAANRVRWYADTRPRIHNLALPRTALADAHDGRLRLHLIPGEPAWPGFYPLLPDAYFTAKQAPPLAA